MFWAAFSFNDRSELRPLDGDPESRHGGITGRIILTTLQEEMPKICGPGSIFAQDNAPTHTCILVQDWLIPWAEEHGFELVDWPPYSPDLNPIENLWKVLKQRICDRYPDLADLPKNQDSLDRLIKAATELWNGLEDDMLGKLISGMQKRMRAVVEANGWYTKY